MLDKEVVRVKVSGEFACFTRPDLKVERMTYPCMTPSAARGILDSILWKPEFQWYVRKILVLEPVKFFSVKRNEINSKQGTNPIIVDEVDSQGKPKYRTQRNSIILRDVAYIIEASVYQKEVSDSNPPRKYTEMFKRRVKKGQCYRRPFLGTREFAAEFTEPDNSDKARNETIPVGSMLFDIFFDITGKPSPLFFYDVAVMDGILNCEVPENMKMMESSHISPPADSEISAVIYDFKTQEESL
ncbi:MAG: type I-C CRISPR-associated protein Cas5 [Spirochaetes bacterium RBG_16_49_21]|nr:MAG: type I-C CRISPR-associated protein Cas5 [Spirochaetes bacterium RBG_16_49_21]